MVELPVKIDVYRKNEKSRKLFFIRGCVAFIAYEKAFNEIPFNLEKLICKYNQDCKEVF